MKFLAAALVALLLIAIPKSARAYDVQSYNQLYGEDANERVLAKVHAVDQSEIQMAQLTLQKSQDQKIRDFAQMMINDHTQAEQQLAPLAQQLGVGLVDFVPKSRQEIRDDRDDKATLARLQTLDGRDYDQAYINAQVKAHTKALAWLRVNAKKADAQAQPFLMQTQQTVAEHLRMAKDLQNNRD